ncbi:MAG: SDR family NAD(P)-dependent oxidoreductase [Ilumatobacter sp.]|nr:SDR family NAD(P)-dependent oxidoreductase [Ilumatobacter sp.]
MESFAGKIAVVTGGGTGMGRELVVQLAAAGAHVSMCDLSEDRMSETAALAAAAAPASDVRISTHVCDVSDEAAMLVFRDEVLAAHDSEHVNLLFNNAGLSGGGSIVTDSRESWDRCFEVCFNGVRWGTLAFLDALIASDEGHIVNTSSVNGFWASIGPDRPHTAYSAAKFAVKGFTEALVTDMRVNAPHVGVSVVMPGHIGTSIVQNSMNYGARELTDDERELMTVADQMFHDNAPMSADDAATVILDGVLAGQWRILVGEDAVALDAAVRADPEAAYEGSMHEILFAELTAAREQLVEQLFD